MKNIAILISVIFYAYGCINKPLPANRNIDNDIVEFSPGLKSVIKSYIKLTQAEDSTIKVYYLTLNKLDEYSSEYRITSIKDIQLINEFPPLKYSIINNKYVLFTIGYNRQILDEISKKPLNGILKKYLKQASYQSKCWEILIENDSITRVNKYCDGHQFLRKIKNIYAPAEPEITKNK